MHLRKGIVLQKQSLVQPFKTRIILFNGVWYNSENNYPHAGTLDIKMMELST